MVTVVTGASGFLGGTLVRQLLAEGRRVRAVDIQRGSALEDLNIGWARADVLDPSSLDAALANAEIVYHLAAVISVTGDPTGRVKAINVDGVRNVALAARRAGVRRMVHCSSVHAYDLETDTPEITEESPRAVSTHIPAYDRSKAAGEAALREVMDDGLDAVTVNPTGVIGPYDFAPSRMGRVFVALFGGKLPALIDGGFNWVDVRDVARSMIAAETDGRGGENYLLPGHHRSLSELAALTEQITGVPPPRFTVPMRVARLLTPFTSFSGDSAGSPLFTSESLHALRFSPPVSGSKAAAELGHTSRSTDTTVADIHSWFDEQGALA